MIFNLIYAHDGLITLLYPGFVSW